MPVIDLAHLELFTEGDLSQEKKLSDVFLSVGEESLQQLREHVNGKNSAENWEGAAHKLKGSSAQLGAGGLSVLCRQAEEGFALSLPEKRELLGKIEKAFNNVREFFEKRQGNH